MQRRAIVWRGAQSRPPLRFGLTVTTLGLQQTGQLGGGRAAGIAGRLIFPAQDGFRLVGAAFPHHAAGQP